MDYGMLGRALMTAFFAFVALCVYQVLTGQINLRGMTLDRESGEVLPERVLLLFGTVLGSLYYVLHTVHAAHRTHVLAIPEVPDLLLDVFIASQGLYLGGKVFRSQK